MPALNQKAFLGFRKPKVLKHMQKKWGNKPRSSHDMDAVSFLNVLLSKYDHRMRPTTTNLKSSGLGESKKIPTFVLRAEMRSVILGRLCLYLSFEIKDHL